MQITRAQLDHATAEGLLSAGQGAALWAFLAARRPPETPRFKPAHILYYLGGLVAIGAMTLFITLGFERFGGVGLLLIALAYMAAALWATEHLLKRRQLPIPAGVTAALAVALVPLAVYAAQHVAGRWPPSAAAELAYRNYHTHIDWRWLMMELATLAAGAAVLWRYRLPFSVLPVAVTLWYLGMDVVPFLLGGRSSDFISDEGKRISTAFGLAMIGLAVWVDARSRTPRDFAFWLYLFGLLTFWGGLTSMNSNSETGKLIYAGINLLLIAAGAALARRVFVVFGGIGVALYLGHLSHAVFKDSIAFPFALTAIGFGIIAVGIQWQRHEAAIGTWLRSRLPAAVGRFVEHRAGV